MPCFLVCNWQLIVTFSFECLVCVLLILPILFCPLVVLVGKQILPYLIKKYPHLIAQLVVLDNMFNMQLMPNVQMQLCLFMKYMSII